MNVVILCGGLGTRLREETEFIPKPMVDIGGQPILWHIMKIYGVFGYGDFVLCLGYKGDVIRRYFIDYDVLNSDVTVDLGTRQVTRHSRAHDEQDWRVTLAETGNSTMTGGRIKRVLQYVQGDTFMVTYGDAVADVNIAELLDFHFKHGKVATLTAVRPPSRFGRIEFTSSVDLVGRFQEKPDGAGGWINGGFFVFDRRIEEYLDGDECVLEKGPLERLAKEGELAAYRHEKFWQCMDTLRDAEYLRKTWETGHAPWAIWERPMASIYDASPPGWPRR